jgi:hypothetical protein
MAFPADYTLLMTYTLPTMSGVTTDFPLLLRFDDFTSEALALLDTGGGDLRISADESGSTQMPIDIQRFVKSSGGIEAWTLVPSAETGTVIYIWGDNTGDSQPAASSTYGSQAVWTNFDLVIHQGTTVDATGTHTVTLNGSPSLTSMLWGGQGYDLNSNSKYLVVSHASTLNIQKNYSIDIWINTVSNGFAHVLLDKTNGNTSGYRTFELSAGPSRNRHPELTGQNLDSSSGGYGLQRMGLNMDGTTRENWLDGAFEISDTPTGTVTNNTADMYLGIFDNLTNSLNGILGDVWVSATSNRNPNRADEQSNQTSVGAWGTPANVSLAQTLTPTGIISAEAFGTTTIATGAVIVSPSGIVSGEAFGNALVSSGAVLVGVQGIPSEEAFGLPVINAFITLSPTSIVSAESFGLPVINTAITVAPTGVLPREAFGIPLVENQLQIVQVSGITSAFVSGNHLVKNGDGTLIPITDRETFEAVAQYLRSIGFTGQVNEVWLEWLNSEGYSGEFNEALFSYLESQGYDQSLTDRLYRWRYNK